MDQDQFDRCRAAQIKALKAMDEKSAVKVIDLVEMLLRENPTLPVFMRVGTEQVPVSYVQADTKTIQIGG